MSATPSKKFTDERSSAVVRGEICNHGTQRIHREFQSFDPGVLPPAERLIYDHARALEDRGENVNIITLAKSLDDAGKLDLAGGAGTILPGDQIDEVVWAAVRSLVECHKRSKMAKIGTLLSEGTLDHVDAIRQLEVIASSSDNRRRSRIFQNSKLAAYKSAEDPNGLLGINGGWIRKGKCGLFFGPAGGGKSTLRTHASITWALGRPWFGIEPRGPLRSLILQAENDEGDEAESFQDIARGLGASVVELEPKIIIAEAWCTGRDFTDELDYLLGQHQVDLVWIDPLFSFAGDDLSLQRPASQFLREFLDPVLKRHGVGAFLLHHQGKPPRGKQDKDQLDPSNTYFGSVELSAFPRAMMALSQRDDGTFELLATKRGRRAGLRNLDGDHVEKILLKHADEGIGWEQLPGDPEGSEESGGKGRPTADRMVEFAKHRQKIAPYSKELSSATAAEIAQQMSIGVRQVRTYEHNLKAIIPLINSLSFK